MGAIVGMECPGCGRTQELEIGNGLRDWEKESLLRAFPAKERPDVEALVKQGLERFSLTRKAGLCTACHSYKAVPCAELYTVGGQAYSAGGRCPDCGTVLRHLWSEQEMKPQVLCPKCGSLATCRVVGRWD